jgi:hypothetical protein
MAERVRRRQIETAAQIQATERTVNLGEEFLLFPTNATKNVPDTRTGEFDMEHYSTITVVDPVNGFRLPLSIHATHDFVDEGVVSVDIRTTSLGSDLLTARRKLRRKKVIPFIASLRLVVSQGKRSSEELIPQINDKVNGISFYLPEALNESSDGVGELKGRLFSITAENP